MNNYDPELMGAYMAERFAPAEDTLELRAAIAGTTAYKCYVLKIALLGLWRAIVGRFAGIKNHEP